MDFFYFFFFFLEPDFFPLEALAVFFAAACFCGAGALLAVCFAAGAEALDSEAVSAFLSLPVTLFFMRLKNPSLAFGKVYTADPSDGKT